MKLKKHLDLFCTSDMRNFSREVPMLLGGGLYNYDITKKNNTQDEGRFVDA